MSNEDYTTTVNSLAAELNALNTVSANIQSQFTTPERTPRVSPAIAFLAGKGPSDDAYRESLKHEWVTPFKKELNKIQVRRRMDSRGVNRQRRRKEAKRQEAIRDARKKTAEEEGDNEAEEAVEN